MVPPQQIRYSAYRHFTMVGNLYCYGTTPVTVNGIASSPYTFVVSPTVLTGYTITALSDANCSGTGSGIAIITINPKPTINVVAAPSFVICNGSSTTLTASGASTYSWSPATGLSSTTGTTVVANPTVTTTYTVTGTDVNGCVNTKNVTVIVNNGPVTTGIAVCQGGAGTLTSVACVGGTSPPGLPILRSAQT